jgi:hypothetical protein
MCFESLNLSWVPVYIVSNVLTGVIITIQKRG